MRFFEQTFLSIFLLSGSTSATNTSLPRTLYQFENPTWLENIAALRNGSLLTGIIGRSAGELHLINPFVEPATASVVTAFPDVDSVFGISEYEPDVFAVAVGNYSTTTGPTNGTWAVWSVDLSGEGDARVKKIVDIEEAGLLNGVAAVNEHTVLLADSYAGKIWSVNPQIGEYGVAIEDESLHSDLSKPLGLGVNGLKVSGSYIYYSNDVQTSVNRVKIDLHTGHVVGPFTRIASGLDVPDDLAVTDDGTIFLARPYGNVLERITLEGEVMDVAGSEEELTVAGATSAALGRTWRDRGVVYVATNGGVLRNGTVLEGGKVVAIGV